MLRLIFLVFIMTILSLKAEFVTWSNLVARSEKELAKSVAADLVDGSKYNKLFNDLDKETKESLVAFLKYAYTAEGMDGGVAMINSIVIYKIYIRIGHERFWAAAGELPLNIQRQIRWSVDLSIKLSQEEKNKLKN